MKRKLIAACVAVVLLVCTLGVSAMAINYDFSFTLTPNGSSDLDAPGKKGDDEPRCYVTTTGGSVVSNNLTYKVRARDNSNHAEATQLSNPLTGAVTRLTLAYKAPYLEKFAEGRWAEDTFILAASLHSGNPGSYNLNGRWNP